MLTVYRERITDDPFHLIPILADISFSFSDSFHPGRYQQPDASPLPWMLFESGIRVWPS
jgi:hypothetical protein